MNEKGNGVVMQKIDSDKTIKPLDRWRKFSYTVYTDAETQKIIAGSARSGGCSAPGR